MSYEFYNPSIAAHQLGLGQLPPGLFFANKLRPREVVNHSSEFLRIRQFEDALPHIDAEGWKCGPFTSSLFQIWWQEWAQHLFCNSVTPLCQSLDPSFQFEVEVSTCSLFFFLMDDAIPFSPHNAYHHVACRTWAPFHP
jgi:hypothetical protein